MKKRNKQELELHFWSKVDIGKKDECWNWNGSYFPQGYGQFHVNRIPIQASRFSFIVTFGEPKNLVLHKCDNRACCNPNHLYDGNQKQNMADRMERGVYHTRFTGHKRAKLVGAKFKQFKSRIIAGEKPCVIASDYGIHFSTACKIAKKLFSK